MKRRSETPSGAVPQDRCEDCRHIPECPIRGATGGGPNGDMKAGSRVLERGDHLFRAGETAECIHLLKSGILKGYLLSPAGEEQVVAFYLPGDLVGLESMELPRQTFCVEALSLSRTCTLSREEVTELCARSQPVLRCLLGQASRRLRHDASMFALLGCRSADRRVAAFLLELSRRMKKRGVPTRELELEMTRADIGSYLALAVETVSRVLTRLRKNGVIEVERNRRVSIIDSDAMELVAGGAFPPRSQ